ncbi:hypothetical protein V2G26_000864 [Clonostachys chloroleuca]
MPASDVKGFCPAPPLREASRHILNVGSHFFFVSPTYPRQIRSLPRLLDILAIGLALVLLRSIRGVSPLKQRPSPGVQRQHPRWKSTYSVPNSTLSLALLHLSINFKPRLCSLVSRSGC